MVMYNSVFADAMRAEPLPTIRINLSILGRSNADAGAMEQILATVAAHHEMFLYRLTADAP